MSIWDFWASKYEKLWVQKYSLGPTRKAILRELKALINNRPQINLLDVGCGTGQLTREIENNFRNSIDYIEGVDYSKAMIKEAQKNEAAIVYTNSSIKEYSTEKKFDLITCTHSFPYYNDKKDTIEKFYKLLKRDGYVFLAQASERSIYDRVAMFFVKFTTTKAKYLSPKDVKKLTEKYFVMEEEILIKERWYMPSIMLFKLRRKSSEDITN